MGSILESKSVFAKWQAAAERRKAEATANEQIHDLPDQENEEEFRFSEELLEGFEDMEVFPGHLASRPPDDGRLSIYNGKRDRRGRQSRRGPKKPRKKNVRRGGARC